MIRTCLWAALLLSIVLISSSCAAMFTGTSETLYVRSDEPSTRFFLNERDLGTGTSAVTTVQKKKLNTSTFRVVKEGCHDKSMPIETAFNPVTLLGIFLDWGVVSIVVVDWLATGAVTKASQTQYVLTPECTPTTVQTSFLGPMTEPHRQLEALLRALP